jgi:hypothetical protein
VSAPKYGLYWARRDTRWDVYPQREPLQLVKYEWEGFFAPTQDGQWYKTVASFDLARTATEAEIAAAQWDTNKPARLIHSSEAAS